MLLLYIPFCIVVLYSIFQEHYTTYFLYSVFNHYEIALLSCIVLYSGIIRDLVFNFYKIFLLKLLTYYIICSILYIDKQFKEALYELQKISSKIVKNEH